MAKFDLEVVFNQFEALLWLSISLGLLIYVLWQRIRRIPIPPTQLFLIPAFALFGFSDWIEAQTGAWWRPWWLLLMKALCITVFLYAFLDHLKSRKKGSLQPKNSL